MSEFWLQVVAGVVVAGIVGAVGVYTTYVVLGKRVDQLETDRERQRLEFEAQLASVRTEVSAKADAEAVATKYAEHEARLRASELQLGGLAVSMGKVETDVRWIRETLEKRERGVR